MKRHPLISALTITITLASWTPGWTAESTADFLHNNIRYKINGAHFFLNSRYHEIARSVGKKYAIDYIAYDRKHKIPMMEFNHKASMIDFMKDNPKKYSEMKKLRLEYMQSEGLLYSQASKDLLKTIEQDENLLDGYLSMLREALDLLIEVDPMFQYVFSTHQGKKKWGTLLKRVVRSSEFNRRIPAQTAPLKVQTVFGKPSKVPIMIKFSPEAFESLAFLRATLIHELNRAYFQQGPYLKSAGASGANKNDPHFTFMRHYLKVVTPHKQPYQHQLIQEYYGLSSQLFWHALVKTRPGKGFQLSPEHIKRIKKTIKWTHSKMSVSSLRFVKHHPEPPIFRLIQFFN